MNIEENLASSSKALKVGIACDQSILVLRVYLRDIVRGVQTFTGMKKKTSNKQDGHKQDWLNKTVLGNYM